MQHNTNTRSVKALVIDSLAMVDRNYKPVVDVELTDEQMQTARDLAHSMSQIPTGAGMDEVASFLRKCRQDELDGPLMLALPMADLLRSQKGLIFGNPHLSNMRLTLGRAMGDMHIRQPLNVAGLLGPIKDVSND